QIKDPPPAQYFLPYRQMERVGAVNYDCRSTRSAAQLVSTIPSTIRRVDASLPVENLRTLQEQMTLTLGLDRFLTAMSVGFALLATLLAAIGLYGVVSFTVTERTKEIGLRIALGAETTRIGRLVLARVGWITLVGTGVGLFAAVALSQLARSQLFGVDHADSALLGAAALCISGIAFIAGLLPTWRAVSVDPLVALRTE